MAGMFEITSNLILNNLENNLNTVSYLSSILYYGPYLNPKFLKDPIRLYQPNLNRNLIGVENRKRTIIYQ
jgi:hypothetical protein